MPLLKRLLHALGLYRSDEALPILKPILEAVDDLAHQEGRSREAVAAELLAMALERRQAHEFYIHCWEQLTPREQEVAALVCLGYTNRQIARELAISFSTVKTHVHHILSKFEFSSRADLQAALANWDLVAWLEAR